jgi:class 3 adenylate cyclase/tetratricopeptide (TPR) repeat protein
VVCPACAAENREGAKFCVECGTPLALRCPACGAPHEAGQRFCAECGRALSAAAAVAAPAPAAELRTASVLFVDLVGYTALSESREAEDVRELLSRYFETARTIVGRYDGTVEKFIGDAVMAVWGAPLAREDDAERAVRAALELVDAVTAFGEEVGAPELRARAGVVTGQVASVVNPGEGLVVGDRVNTAARVQSAAEPGTVYVDEVTRQASSAAIAYADAGAHAVKGKAEPLRLWRAERVVAGAGGAQRAEGLAAPFLGRDPELRLLKELFHTAVDRRQPRLITVAGAAGVGKSRLRQEFENYADGLALEVLWHSGRCLSYGDGVAYWALAEMVRQRMGIEEDAAAEVADRKLALGLERWLVDAAEREFVGERLRALLGLAEPGLSRAELFAGWRLLFERLADHSPVVLAFEDVQWADDGLLDFVDHLLDWSAGRSIVVLAFARTELAERRPGWMGGRAGVSPIFLEPLEDRVVGELLDAMVTGLPPAVRDRIVAQAEGMALYALETVRALQDQGLLADAGGSLAVQGEIGADLAVPASLASLLTARLDALPPAERTLVKDLAVMGGSFPRSAVRAVSALPDADLDPLLAALVRKQVLAVRADPLSPDSGQYVFAQTLLRTVAYDMLSRHERKPRHLAIAAHLQATFGNDGEEIAEVIAAHLLDAYRAAAGDPDEDELRAGALAALRRGAQRAASVGAPETAARTYRTAAELAAGPAERADLLTQAANMALDAGSYESALAAYEAAGLGFEEAGDHRAALLLAAPICRTLTLQGRNTEGANRAGAALRELGADTGGGDLAALFLARGHALLFAGELAEAEPLLQRAIELAQAFELPLTLCQALTQRATVCARQGRIEEARLLYAGGAEVASRHGFRPDRARALLNSGNLRWLYDLPEAEEHSREALAVAQRLGQRGWESVSGGNLVGVLLTLGRWDEAQAIAEQMLADGDERPDRANLDARLVLLHCMRGDVAAARPHLERMVAWRETEDQEAHYMFRAAEVTVALAEDAAAPVVDDALDILQRSMPATGVAGEAVRQVFPIAAEAAPRLGLLDRAEALVALLGGLPPGHVPASLRVELAALRGRLAAARGEHAAAEADLRAAVEGARRLGQPYRLARAETAFAEWLLERNRGDEAGPLLDHAATVLQELGAAPSLDRVLRLRDERPAPIQA